MASEQKIAANRANAKKSSGPRTAKGKRRSSANAMRHGLATAVNPSFELILRAEQAARALGLEPATSAQEVKALATAEAELERIRNVRGATLNMLRAQAYQINPTRCHLHLQCSRAWPAMSGGRCRAKEKRFAGLPKLKTSE